MKTIRLTSSLIIAILFAYLSETSCKQAKAIEELDIATDADSDDGVEGKLDGRIRFNGHSSWNKLRVKSRPPTVQLVSSDVNSRQLKDQYNTFNIGYDDDYQDRRPYNPYYQRPQRQDPYYPYYPQPYPYPYPPPPTTTTTTTTTAKPTPPKPIGYMLIDTYHSPQGQSYSHPIAYFHARK